MIARDTTERNVRKKKGFYDIRCVCEKIKHETPHNILIFKEYFVGFHSLSQQVSH